MRNNYYERGSEKMTYEEIVSLVKSKIKNDVAKNITEPASVEVDISGEGEGAFYIEAKDGEIFVEPFEYYNHNVKITLPADELLKIVNGEKTVSECLTEDSVFVTGDEDVLVKLMSFKTAKKTAAKTSGTTAKKAVKAEKKIVAAAKKPTSKVAKDIKK